MDKMRLRRILAQNVAARMEASEDLRSQPALEAKSGVSQTHISRLLRCTSGVTVDVLAGISKAFRCQPWELLVDDEGTRREALERMLRLKG